MRFYEDYIAVYSIQCGGEFNVYLNMEEIGTHHIRIEEVKSLYVKKSAYMQM